MDPSYESIEERLRRATEECARVQAENLRLRELLLAHGIEIRSTTECLAGGSSAAGNGIANASSPAQNLALFRSLFRGREDVYAARWEAKDGRSGYSPACLMDWHAIRAAPPEERKKLRSSICQWAPSGRLAAERVSKPEGLTSQSFRAYSVRARLETL